MSADPSVETQAADNVEISSRQTLLKENIIDKGFDGSAFIKHLEAAKPQGADLQKWTEKELLVEIEAFQKLEGISTAAPAPVSTPIGLKPKNAALFADSDDEEQGAKNQPPPSFDPKKSRLEAYIKDKGDADSDEESPLKTSPETRRHKTTLGESGLALDIEMQIADQALTKTIPCVKL